MLKSVLLEWVLLSEDASTIATVGDHAKAQSTRAEKGSTFLNGATHEKNTHADPHKKKIADSEQMAKHGALHVKVAQAHLDAAESHGKAAKFHSKQGDAKLAAHHAAKAENHHNWAKTHKAASTAAPDAKIDQEFVNAFTGKK